MPQAPYGLHTNWLSCFLIDERRFGCSRDELIRALDEAARDHGLYDPNYAMLGAVMVGGAGAVVLKDAPARCTVIGVPARRLD